MGKLKWLRDFGAKHGSTLCVIGAIVGNAVTIYVTWTSRPKVDKVLAEQNEKRASIEINPELDEEGKKKARKDVNVETAKRVGLAVLPIGIAAGATTGFTVASKVIDSRKIADMATLITMSDVAYQRLEEKTKELVGEEKLIDMKKEIAQEDLRKDLIADEILTDEGTWLDIDGFEQGYGGDQLFYDMTYGRTFRSDVTTIKKAVERMNSKLTSGAEKFFTYNEFFVELGLRQVPAGDGLGWGVYSPDATSLQPNCSNTIRIGDRSFIVLDWIVRPSSHFK